jgi:hypothetical protein
VSSICQGREGPAVEFTNAPGGGGAAARSIHQPNTVYSAGFTSPSRAPTSRIDAQGRPRRRTSCRRSARRTGACASGSHFIISAHNPVCSIRRAGHLPVVEPGDVGTHQRRPDGQRSSEWATFVQTIFALAESPAMSSFVRAPTTGACT